MLKAGIDCSKVLTMDYSCFVKAINFKVIIIMVAIIIVESLRVKMSFIMVID